MADSLIGQRLTKKGLHKPERPTFIAREELHRLERELVFGRNPGPGFGHGSLTILVPIQGLSQSQVVVDVSIVNG